MSEATVRAAFAKQGEWCRLFGAPFTARVCETLAGGLDRSTAVGRHVLDWPGDPWADALMMRLTGGLNGLVRAGSAPGLAACYPPHDAAGLDAALAVTLADDRLLPWLESAPQTNEVARSAVLMPGLLTIAAATGLPLALYELGTSGGLNLRLDSYRYRLGGRDVGPADAALVLAPQWSGADPPDADVVVASRRGVDLAPLDLLDATAQSRLLAYVWPDQPDRVARLTTAIAGFVADPVALDRGDAADWVEAVIAPVPGVVTTVFHSIAFHYFPESTKVRIRALLDAMGARATPDAPLAWLRYEEDVAGAGVLPMLRLLLWPDGDDRLLAHAHPHGASVQWLG